MRVFQHAIKICRVNIEKNQNLLGGWALEGWVLDALFNFKGDVKDIVSIFYSLSNKTRIYRLSRNYKKF